MESRLVERGLVEFLLVETSFLGMIGGNFHSWKFSFVEIFIRGNSWGFKGAEPPCKEKHMEGVGACSPIGH